MEAIGNQAFSKMDMGSYPSAVEDFEQSLKIEVSLLPIFKIGECYFQMGDYAKTKPYFEKALEITPGQEQIKAYLQKTVEN